MLLVRSLVLITVAAGGLICRGAEASVDASAESVLRNLGTQLAAMKTAEVNLHLAVKTALAPQGELAADYLLSVERPNKMALVLKTGNVGATVVCDGTNAVTFIPNPQVYTIQKAPLKIGAIENASSTGDLGSMAFITALFSENPAKALLTGVLEAKFSGREKIDEREFDCVEMKQEGLNWKLFTTVGENPIVRRINVTIPQLSMSMDFTGWKLNQPIPLERFVFVPPPGARKVDKLLDEDEKEGEDSALIGEAMPKLKLKFLEGDTFDTSTLKDRTALIVVWGGEAKHCASAIQAAAEIAATRKGISAYTINIDEKPNKTRIKDYLGSRKLTLKTALDQDGEAIDKLDIEGVPMTLLVRRGFIEKAFLGYHADFKTLIVKELDALQPEAK